MVAAATGSDGGGSIRIPAACCGLVGMKPSRGRVTLAPMQDEWLGLSTFGALGRSVRDSAVLLDVIHGTLPSDPFRLPAPSGTFAAAAAAPPHARLRIAVSRKLPPGTVARLSPDQRLAFERTARLLDELGHDVQERSPKWGMIGVHFLQSWVRGVYEDSLKIPDRSLLEPSTRQMAAAGRLLVPDRRRARLLAARAGHTARVLGLWDDVDVLVTPGLASTAIAAEGGYGRPAPVAFDKAGRFPPWTPPFTVTGQPAVTLPAGLGADSMPLSVQLVGRIGAEEQLYSLAAQIEAAQPWESLRPPIS
jgi:amidase